MIRAKFIESKGTLTGFRISGHAGYAESGQDIVCAAVSSAVQLAANIITEGCGIPAEVTAENNEIYFSLESADKTAEAVIDMLKKHIEAVSEEFPKTIKITTTEV